MINNILKTKQIERWLYIFIFLHVFFWTLAPAWVRFTLPMDAMEGTTWGHQMELGYDKNPFLNAWLTHFAVWLGGQSGWMTYLFSQISVGICFWAVWQLSKNILPPIYALISVLLLESIQYYNLHSIDFNDNTLELGLWALTILFFYRAIKRTTLIDWLLTGLFAGLGMMAKYYTIMLLLPMFLFLLANNEARQQFKAWQPYAALGLFLCIVMPHFVWLFSHQFVTVQYAMGRVSSEPRLINHLLFPLKFAYQQFLALVPTFLLLVILLIGKRPIFLKDRPVITNFNKAFLLFMGAGPILLTIALSAVTGITLRAGWGQPLFSLFGIIFMAALMPALSREKFRSFLMVLFSLFGVMVIVYSAALIRAAKPSSANFPGEMIASELAREWHEQYHTSLSYVAGPRWIAGNVAFYAKDHPAVYMEWNPAVSPWIDEKTLKHAGAIFIWDPTEARQISQQEIRARFPGLGPVKVMRFGWLRNKNMKPVEISVAFLAPGAGRG